MDEMEVYIKSIYGVLLQEDQDLDYIFNIRIK
jgi:hypothetical protein